MKCQYVSLVFSILLASYAPGTIGQSPAEDLLRKQQDWGIRCMDKGCMASVDILRGESGDPPDPHDVNQYLSLAVGLDRKDQRPSVIIVQVDPHADPKSGVDLFFARTVPDGTNWKLVLDKAAAVHLPFKGCNDSACAAAIGGGNPDETAMKSCADLIQRMQTEDHLFVVYYRGGQMYRTAVNLKLFKEAYERLKDETTRQGSSANY